jgi:hypothetical protein
MHIQLKNRLWTTVAFLHCCNLIWGLANNNYSLYFLLFLTDSDSVNIHLCYIFLKSCIPVIFYMLPHPPLFLLKYYCAVIQYHTNCNNSYLLEWCFCQFAQWSNYIAREWKYSTNVYWHCHCQSKTEESKGCNYYLPDLKSDCNNGGKLL